MLRANPVFTNIGRGLLVPSVGEAQRTWFACLCIQAVALVLWWPRTALIDALAAQHRPEPLTAMMAALGVTLAYFSLRAGAEEFLLEGQQSLREWVLSTRLSVGRILRGSVGGQLSQLLCCMLFAVPLIGVGFAVSGGEWQLVAQNLCMVLVQAVFFYLAGASIYLRLGHYGQTTYITIRALLAGVYLFTALRLSPASHLLVSIDSLGADDHAIDFDVTVPPYQVFLLVHGVMIVALLLMLYLQMRRLRAGQTAS